jgi:hypothetical protein
MIDYDAFGVSAELNRQIFAAQLKLRGEHRDSLRVAAVFGALLAKAKEDCRHGEFVNWLKIHFEGSERHARRLMRVARRYPDAEAIPTLSLNEALRLMTGKGPKENIERAQDRLSGETCATVLASLPEVLKLIDNRSIAPLELEGLTDRHPAMKAARKIAIDVHRFRGVVENLRAPERVSGADRDDRFGPPLAPGLKSVPPQIPAAPPKNEGILDKLRRRQYAVETGCDRWRLMKK